MATSGTGLYDNDAALDALGDFVGGIAVDPSAKNVAKFCVAVGLRLWLQPTGAAKLAGQLEGIVDHDNWDTLSAEVQKVLGALLADPEAATTPASRSEDTQAVLGTGLSGRHYPALFAVEGARDVLVDAIVTPGQRALQRMVRRKTADLVQASAWLTLLGPLLELLDAGLLEEADLEGAADWLVAFDRADANTAGERNFWNEYVARVRPGLYRLTVAFDEEPAEAVRRYRITETFEEGDRVEHKKFGVGFVRWIEEDRIGVEFPSGHKKLIHGR
jgi:hypothetical protein